LRTTATTRPTYSRRRWRTPAASTREKLRDALSKIKTRELTSGVPIEFDKNGARKEYMYFMQILSVDGKRTYKSKQLYYNEWDAEVIPVYDLVK